MWNPSRAEGNPETAREPGEHRALGSRQAEMSWGTRGESGGRSWLCSMTYLIGIFGAKGLWWNRMTHQESSVFKLSRNCRGVVLHHNGNHSHWAENRRHSCCKHRKTGWRHGHQGGLSSHPNYSSVGGMLLGCLGPCPPTHQKSKVRTK